MLRLLLLSVSLLGVLCYGQLWGMAHRMDADTNDDVPCVGALVRHEGHVAFLTTGRCIAYHHGTGQRYRVELNGVDYYGVGQTRFRLSDPVSETNLNVGFVLPTGSSTPRLDQVFTLPEPGSFKQLYPPVPVPGTSYAALQAIPRERRCHVMHAVAIQQDLRVLCDCDLRYEGTLLTHNRTTLYGLMSRDGRKEPPNRSNSFFRLDTLQLRQLWQEMQSIVMIAIP